eukprot:365249-Chlamydomonas_euryale.AAC.25
MTSSAFHRSASFCAAASCEIASANAGRHRADVRRDRPKGWRRIGASSAGPADQLVSRPSRLTLPGRWAAIPRPWSAGCRWPAGKVMTGRPSMARGKGTGDRMVCGVAVTPSSVGCYGSVGDHAIPGALASLAGH